MVVSLSSSSLRQVTTLEGSATSEGQGVGCEGTTLEGSAASEGQGAGREGTDQGVGAGGGTDPFSEGRPDSDNEGGLTLHQNAPKRWVQLVLWVKVCHLVVAPRAMLI